MGRDNKKQRSNWVKCFIFIMVLGCHGILGRPLDGFGAEEEVFVPSTVPAPVFSVPAGFYEEEFTLELAAEEGLEIYYTLDGSEPVADGVQTMAYLEPIVIELCESVKGQELLSATVVRAVCVTEDGEYSDVQTNTYFVAEKMSDWYQVPVVSLVADPTAFYDEETGIITNYDERGREWERPAHLEYFTPTGEREVSMNVGVRINGAYSRRFDMKSFRIYARAEYDTQKNIKYDFFSGGLIPAMEKNGEQKNIEKFKRIILRAGGNESDAWETTFFRDILAQSAMVGTSLDLQSYQPAVTYVNGEFYGVLNIRERMDDRYLASHYNCSETDVAIYGFHYNKNEDGKVILPAAGEDVFTVEMEEGPEEEAAFFEEAYDFVTENDMSDPVQYEKAQSYFDIENFIDYLCIELYSGTTDWPHNNCEAWRYTGEPSEEYGLDGKIRWLLFDLDFAFGLYGHSVEELTIASMVADQRHEQPYRDVLTCLFRAFLKNDGFKEQFRSRFTELLDTNLSAVEWKKKIDILEEIYGPLVTEKYLKYGKKQDFRINVDIVREYTAKRAGVMKRSLTWVLDEELHENSVDSPILKRRRAVTICIVLGIGICIVAFVWYRKKKEEERIYGKPEKEEKKEKQEKNQKRDVDIYLKKK
ncbi:MAG: CotH kinase family protein [Lachnospiraceae bacterium]|nr:CotH kinase family protein [Lachnospiraceae bacterium]